MKNIIITKNAPEPIGPYSQGVATGNLLFVSGQVGKNPVTGKMQEESIEAEARQVMNNIKAVLEQAGIGMERIVKTTIFLTDIDNFGKVNEVYASFFTGDYPARETVEVSRLPVNARIEISVIAIV